MGTLYCDGGANNGTYLSNSADILSIGSLDTPYDVPANWTSASPSPHLWVGVIASGSDYKIKFWDDNPTDTADVSTTATATVNFTGSPLEFQIQADSSGAITNVSPDPNGFDGPQNLVVYVNGAVSHGVKFKFVPTISAGPSVTSITEDTVYVPTDTVVASDFTLTKNTSSYATSNISLTGPTTMTNSGNRGYLYDLVSNVSHDSAVYDFTIDSKSFVKFRYNSSWTSNPTSSRTTNSSRILNVLGRIPNTTVMTATGPTLPSNNGSDQLWNIVRSNWFIEYAIGPSYNGNYPDAPDERVAFVIKQTGTDIVSYFYYYNAASISNTYIESTPVQIGSVQTHTWAVPLTVSSGSFGALELSVTDWVYSAEPEGDGYTPPTYTPAFTAKGVSRNFW